MCIYNLCSSSCCCNYSSRNIHNNNNYSHSNNNKFKIILVIISIICATLSINPIEVVAIVVKLKAAAAITALLFYTGFILVTGVCC